MHDNKWRNNCSIRTSQFPTQDSLDKFLHCLREKTKITMERIITYGAVVEQTIDFVSIVLFEGRHCDLSRTCISVEWPLNNGCGAIESLLLAFCWSLLFLNGIPPSRQDIFGVSINSGTTRKSWQLHDHLLLHEQTERTPRLVANRMENRSRELHCQSLCLSWTLEIDYQIRYVPVSLTIIIIIMIYMICISFFP